MFLTFSEIADLVAMTMILGVIFGDMLSRFRQRPVDQYMQSAYAYRRFSLDWQNIKFAAMIIAPAIILHELGHKFVALSFGYSATFHAAYFWLFIGLAMRLMNSPFIFFVPAYVSIQNGIGTPASYTLIAFAGPLMNLIIWLGAEYWLRHRKVKREYIPALILTSKINMFLFIFNMLPLPGFDGQKVLTGLLRIIF